MKILAIETSGATFSAALAEGRHLAAEIFWHAGLMHSERLLPNIRRLLDEAGWKFQDIERVAVTTGPGSFTGIRVGITCARTIAQYLRVRVFTATALDLLAAAVPKSGQVVYPVIDALRGEVYVRRAGGGVCIRAVKDVLKALARSRKNILLVGNAVPAHFAGVPKNRAIALAPENLWYPRAGVLAVMAAAHPGKLFSTVKPLYVRRSWAEEKRI